MVYGMKIQEGKIIALTRFKADQVPAGYIAISKEKYRQLQDALQADPFGSYVDGKFVPETDEQKAARAADEATRRQAKLQQKKSRKMAALAEMLREMGVDGTNLDQF